MGSRGQNTRPRIRRGPPLQWPLDSGAQPPRPTRGSRLSAAKSPAAPPPSVTPSVTFAVTACLPCMFVMHVCHV